MTDTAILTCTECGHQMPADVESSPGFNRWPAHCPDCGASTVPALLNYMDSRKRRRKGRPDA